MHPELKSKHINSLEVSFTISLKFALVKNIRKLSQPNTEGDSAFFDTYPYHRLLIIAKNIREKSKTYNFECGFQALSGGRLPKSFPRVPQLLDLLLPLNAKVDCQCNVSYTFGKKVQLNPIIKLPVLYSCASNMPVDKLQGMHLVKERGLDRKYDIYIDSPENEGYIVNIQFSFSSILDNLLPERIISTADLVKNSLVIQGQKND